MSGRAGGKCGVEEKNMMKLTPSISKVSAAYASVLFLCWLDWSKGSVGF